MMTLQSSLLLRFWLVSAATMAVYAAGAYVITTNAGTGVSGYSGDGGAATSARLYAPKGVATTNTNGVLIADVSNHRIRLVYSNGTIITFAGTGVQGSSGDNGPATSAQLSEPTGIAYVKTGAMQGVTLIADMSNQKIRQVTAAGTISTIAGNGTVGFSADGTLATSCMLNYPQAVAVDASGIVYIADFYNNVIRKIAADNRVYTIAGVGTYGYGGDGGPALLATFALPRDIAVDASNNIYIADSYNSVIRMISNGIITTVAGTPQTNGYGGDNGPATCAVMNIVRGVSLDGNSGFYIGDTQNHRVRYVSATGIITTFAGNGTAGSAGDGGPPTSAELNFPRGVALDASGRLLIADGDSQKVRIIAAVPSPSPTVSSSASKTPSQTASHSHTMSAFPSATGTKSTGASSSSTMSPSLSAGVTPSRTDTPVPTDTITGTITPGITSSPSCTASGTHTVTMSPSSVPVSGVDHEYLAIAVLVVAIIGACRF